MKARSFEHPWGLQKSELATPAADVVLALPYDMDYYYE
jgi:hypothetical protein